MTKKNQQIRYTLAAHAIEKLTPSKSALRLCEEVSSGSMTADAAVAAVLQQHGLKKARSHG